MDSDLSIISYNLTGWSNFKAEIVTELLNEHKALICVLQEHFQLDKNLYKLDCFDGYEVFSIPAVKNNNFVNRGRPSGGLSFIYHQQLGKYATPLRVPGSSRVQGLKVVLPNSPFLFINTYLPNDPRTLDFDDSQLINTLEDIKYLINLVDNSYTLVLSGDLNTDFSRDTTFVNIVRDFCNEINVDSVWNTFNCDYTYYHERLQNNRTIVSESVIDHFCVSFQHLNACIEASPLHIKNNQSCHDPIFLKFDKKLLITPSDDQNQPPHDKIQWNRASIEQVHQFKADLSHLLSDVNIDVETLSCQNVNCNLDSHRSAIDEMCIGIFDSISTAVNSNIPSSSCTSKSRLPIPGWNEYVRHWKDLSVFWRAVWISAGRPLDNELHRNMKFHRNRFHYAIRRVKKHEDTLRKNKFFQYCLQNNVNDLFSELRQMRNKNNKQAKMIDGKCSNVEIANHFKETYEQIYNSHDDGDDLRRVMIENAQKISQADLKFVSKINPARVKKNIMRFHNGKNDSFFDWRSDAMKHGVDILAQPLSDILKSMIIHGYIPVMFLVCSLIPIIKDNKASKLDSSNYRLIAITSLLLKIFDLIVLDLFSDNLAPAVHQFGFQPGKSTTLCTWVVTETVNFFTNRGSPLFLGLLDLKKAFDLVKLSKLFCKLSEKIPPIMIRFIVIMYTSQSCHVTWNGIRSDDFSISNGVRQGAVLSPSLFNVYIDDLYEILKKTGFGCKIQGVYFGCFGYADDLALLAPSREALQALINECSVYFREHGITISTHPDIKKTKTKILVFGVKSPPSPLYLNNKQLPIVDSWIHLGHVINTDESSHHDLEEKRRAIVGRVHSLLQELGPQDPSVFFKLMRIYILHLYGCPLWDIYSERATKLWSTWHKTIKMVYDLPYGTHRYLLNDLVTYDHLKKLIIKRFLKFHQSVITCPVPHVQLLHHYQCKDNRSTYGRNIRNILKDSNCRSLKEVDLSRIIINPVPVGCEWKVNFLKYLIKDRYNPQSLLSPDVIWTVMCHICVD